MNPVKILLSLHLLYFSFTTAAQEFPFKPFSAQYDILHNDDYIGITTFSLTRKNENTWLYSNISEATGWISRIFFGEIIQHSIFNWNNGMHILSYRYDRDSLEKHIKLKFDWQNMKVINDINGDHWKMDLSPGTFDKLSINLALGIYLSNGKTNIHIPVADGGKLKIYEFRVIDEELVDTPIGKINTLKVSRNKRGRKDKQAWLWLAPDLNYIIIKAKKNNSDDRFFSMTIKSLQQK